MTLEYTDWKSGSIVLLVQLHMPTCLTCDSTKLLGFCFWSFILFIKLVNFDPATVRELLRIALYVKLEQLGRYLGNKETLSHN